MKYTVRFAHMKEAPKWKRGDVIKIGDVIGTMGNYSIPFITKITLRS